MAVLNLIEINSDFMKPSGEVFAVIALCLSSWCACLRRCIISVRFLYFI
jgi:hypothetical protein